MAQGGGIRVGQVSSVDRAKGMAKVVYNDRDGAVTKMLPLLSFGGQYRPPNPGEYVAVGHLDSGSEGGCILGTYWNGSHTPADADADWNMEIGGGDGDASMTYKEGKYTLKVGEAEVVTEEHKASLDKAGKLTLEVKEAEIRTPSVTVTIDESGKLTLKASSIEFSDSSGSITLQKIISKIG